MTKTRGEGPYPGKTLYQLIAAIQKHLWVHKILWDLIEGKEFIDMKTVLDNVMQERTKANIGMVKKQAQITTYQFKEKMLSGGVLGERKG